ncbi:TIGR02281 family clan AA aspartic protease [Blastomonas sp.]|uniref:retropepsin-like aspartic protease family protein n=1 Tax=Blastomonas sp. TaxID=1909299 RepID=UPI00262BAEA4|nr:TIGR02281 family clan AA aspartic protease [Blastomonas sp.]MDM7957189.1 TIGR02281 family clan AA aspartic protease [Blastomonas sp.]
MTGGSDTASLVYSLLLLVLVGSALISRGLPIGQTLKTALGWIGIFAVIFLLVSFRPELKTIWQRVTGELGFGNTSAISGAPMTLRKESDGHFWVTAEVNGTPVRFMVDSGASYTALSAEAARTAGVEPDRFSMKVVLNTANGIVEADRATVRELRVGSLSMQEHAVVVADAFGDTNVLGMNFLSALESWRVEGGNMILEPALP